MAEDRAKTVAMLLEKAERCTRCGTAEWEWLQDEFAYEPVPRFCPGCHVLGIAEEGERAEKPRPGRFLELLPKAVAAKLRHDPPKPFATRRRRRRE